MFYSEGHSEALRFGDVVIGFVGLDIHMDSLDKGPLNFKIDIKTVPFYVIMTPCCSIEKGKIALAPLIELPDRLLSNPNFIKDFTCLNRKLPTRLAAGEEIWSKLSYEEQMSPPAYAEYELFVYEGWNGFPEYKMKYKREEHTTNFYAINFKDVFKVNAKEIQRDKPELLKYKAQELTIETRNDLRNKMSSFFGRIPNEDISVTI